MRMFSRLRAGVARVLSGEPREPLFSVAAQEPPEGVAKKLLEMPKPAKPAAAAPEEPSPAAQARTAAADGDPNT